jgi:hypothetical protein
MAYFCENFKTRANFLARYLFRNTHCKTQILKTMKNLLLSAILVCFTMFAFAQSLEIWHDGELIENDYTLYIQGEPTAGEIVIEVDVKNVSSAALDVICKKYEVEVIPSTINLFCWGLCFPPFVFESPSPVPIPAGGTVSEFSGHYTASGNAGVTVMRYTFFVQNNPNDSVCFQTNFLASTVGVGEIGNEKLSVSNAYPNPATSQTSFDYVLPQSASQASIRIHNLLGAVVREAVLTDRSGKATINVSDLNDGVYFYSVIVDNQTIETKRLIVSR